MKKLFTLAFWDYAGERSLKTAIQVLLSGGLLGPEIFGWDWKEIASIALASAAISIGTSVLAYKGDGTDDPNAGIGGGD